MRQGLHAVWGATWQRQLLGEVAHTLAVLLHRPLDLAHHIAGSLHPIHPSHACKGEFELTGRRSAAADRLCQRGSASTSIPLSASACSFDRL